MAAIDPTAKVTASEPARSTLKLVKVSAPDMDDSDEEDMDDDDVEAIERRLGLRVADDSDEDEEDSDDEEKNGGPSDPTRSKKARAEALIKALEEEAEEDEEMEEAGVPNGVNGAKIDKGKAKATGDDDDEDDDEEDDDEDAEDIKEYVICTLDPEKVCRPLENIWHTRRDLTRCTALPAATRHHNQQRERDVLLQGHRPVQSLSHRQLCHPARC
jgi:FK506-binding nuclear protein